MMEMLISNLKGILIKQRTRIQLNEIISQDARNRPGRVNNVPVGYDLNLYFNTKRELSQFV